MSAATSSREFQKKVAAESSEGSVSDDDELSPSIGQSESPESGGPKRWMIPVAVALLVAAGAFGAYTFLFKKGGPKMAKAAVREPLPPGMHQCLVYGDPHVANYDHTAPEPSFHGAGEYWLTKTDDGVAVLIQGQFSIPQIGKARTALTHIAITGAFVGGRKVQIGPLGTGDVRLDGVPILRAFPSAYFLPNGMGTFTYNDVGVIVDDEMLGMENKVVTLRFTRGVSLSIFRWEDYLDVRIRMPSNVGVSGICGNNNGVGEDDTTEAIYSMGNARVEAGASLFPSQVNTALSEASAMLLAKCEPMLKEEAAEVCLDVVESQRQQCMVDICTGTEEHKETQVTMPVVA